MYSAWPERRLGCSFWGLFWGLVGLEEEEDIVGGVWIGLGVVVIVLVGVLRLSGRWISSIEHFDERNSHKLMTRETTLIGFDVGQQLY